MIKTGHKIKLLIFVPTLECGGVERNVSIICNNLDTSRYDVTLAVLNNANQFFRIKNPDIKLINLEIKNVRKSLFRILSISRKIRPDIILTTANHLNLLFGIFKWMFPARIKIIARESSIVSVNTQRTWHPAVYHWLLRVFYKQIDFIVCQSKYMQFDLVENYNIKIGKTSIIPNAAIKAELKTGNYVPGRTVNLITVTRLSKDKGIDRLIRAVTRLNIPFRLTVIGEGYMREPLQKLINELSLDSCVFLVGRDGNPFSLVPNPDLFLMVSYYEGFPNAMLEALTAGIPVVAFDAPGGIAELLENYENGILVKDNDEQKFADAIVEALNMNFNREKIREKILDKFNIENIMKQWYDLFEMS